MQMKTYLALLLLFVSSLYGCKLKKGINSKDKVVESEHSKVIIRTSEHGGGSSILRGTIKDMQSEDIIEGAIVKLNKNDTMVQGVISDMYGKFEIKNLTEGKYEIEIRALSFKNFTHPLTIKSGTITDLEVLYKRFEARLEKPVIYLYPTEKTPIHVALNYKGKLTHTYPAYSAQGWEVVAEPNGTLWDKNGQEYYALFWEGIPRKPLEAKDGFIVPGTETAAFLEKKLAYLGLNRREANEFIMHWLPRMENHPYNLVHFAGTDYEALASLHISPKPETLIRIMMLTQPLETKIDFPLQDLSYLQKTRKGFTVVEWGGAELEPISTKISYNK
jgi:hypothetical protein